MSNQTLSFEAYYANYKIAATNAGLPVLGKELIYFAFSAGITPDDAIAKEQQAEMEAQHTAFNEERGYSLKDNPHLLDELLTELETDPDDEEDFDDEDLDDGPLYDENEDDDKY